jgi:hypothetical protein
MIRRALSFALPLTLALFPASAFLRGTRSFFWPDWTAFAVATGLLGAVVAAKLRARPAQPRW